MSTRCQLAIYPDEKSKIESAEVFIYKHSDGYPEGVIPTIMPFLNWFEQNRGISDESYCTARLVAHLVLCNDNTVRKFKSKETSPVTDFVDCLGFGVDTTLHGDIEFFYHISPKMVQVFKTDSDDADSWEIVGIYKIFEVVA